MTSMVLIKNCLSDFENTLFWLSSAEEQIRYQGFVEFVHVPIELIAQWDNHFRMIVEVKWFSDLFSQLEKENIFKFNLIMNDFCDVDYKLLDDLEDYLASNSWKNIISESTLLSEKLNIQEIMLRNGIEVNNETD